MALSKILNTIDAFSKLIKMKEVIKSYCIVCLLTGFRIVTML